MLRFAPPVQGTMPPAAKRAPVRALRVLVVDDNLDQVHTLAHLLKDSGHHVDFAINGIVAIDLAGRIKPDVILLDMVLPDSSGLSIARHVRRTPELEKTYLIAMT